MAELDTSLADTRPEAPVLREGLPRSYRMRAERHYVEELGDAPAAPPIRFLDAHSIEPGDTTPTPASDFVESVKRHGVLQPLLVHGRGNRYRLIAGRQRLAAAMAAGMRHVPCVVQRVDDEEATTLALATNLPSTAPTTPATTAPAHHREDGALVELSRSLGALLSSVNLLTDGSSLSAGFAADLVKAEATRAQQLLWALRVRNDDVTYARDEIRVADLLTRVRQAFLPEQRLRRLNVAFTTENASDVPVRGDHDQLTSALVGILSAAASLPHADAGGPLDVRLHRSEPGREIFDVRRAGLSVPDEWIADCFTTPWPVGAGRTTLALLQASRRVAESHGGELRVASSPAGTSLSMSLPIA